jgi:hypothetical protein
MRDWRIVPPFLTLALVGGRVVKVGYQLHAPATAPSEEQPPGNHCIGGWVNPRSRLDITEKRKSSCPSQESKQNSFIIQPIAYLTIQTKLSYM